MEKNDKCRTCRRVGEKLFLKGEKCNSPKCVFNKKSYAPGLAGPKVRMRRGSDYSLQLREKQKARAIYRVSEKQMQNYFKEARKNRSATGEILIQLLERRLDNIIFRSGFAVSRDEARQMVSHGKIMLNGRRSKTPSQLVSIGDAVKTIQHPEKPLSQKDLPQWLSPMGAGEVKISALPVKEEISLINEQLIIEFYSR